jgi:hypothetical protein
MYMIKEKEKEKEKEKQNINKMKVSNFNSISYRALYILNKKIYRNLQKNYSDR